MTGADKRRNGAVFKIFTYKKSAANRMLMKYI